MSTGSGQETASFLIKDQKGVILLEFALSMIILAALFLGTVTLSLALRDYISVHKVAREGAREAVITGNTSAAYSKAMQAAWLWGLKPENLTIWFDREVDGTRTFETCHVKYRTNLFNYLFPTLVGGSPMKDFDIDQEATFGWWDFT